jgi:hypothetical protein
VAVEVQEGVPCGGGEAGERPAARSGGGERTRGAEVEALERELASLRSELEALRSRLGQT